MFTNKYMYNEIMKEKINKESYMYDSDYVTLEEFSDELYGAFKALFVCKLKRNGNQFTVSFKDGGTFRVTVAEEPQEK